MLGICAIQTVASAGLSSVSRIGSIQQPVRPDIALFVHYGVELGPEIGGSIDAPTLVRDY
jgi:hypothetical protein